MSIIEEKSNQHTTAHDIIDMVSVLDEKENVMQITEGKDAGKIFATMEVGRKPVKMLIDSGASCNVIPNKYVPR